MNPNTFTGEYVRCGWRRAWLMWDMDNGHAWHHGDAGKGYLWVFSTRQEALAHRKQQHAKPDAVRLSMPFKVEGNRKSLARRRRGRCKIILAC